MLAAIYIPPFTARPIQPQFILHTSTGDPERDHPPDKHMRQPTLAVITPMTTSVNATTFQTHIRSVYRALVEQLSL